MEYQNKKIIELQRNFKELSNTYEKTYLTFANKKKSTPPPQPNNEITVGSLCLYTGHPQVNSYGNGGQGRHFNNHNVYIVDIKSDGRAFPCRLGDNSSNKFGWANSYVTSLIFFLFLIFMKISFFLIFLFVF